MWRKWDLQNQFHIWMVESRSCMFFKFCLHCPRWVSSTPFSILFHLPAQLKCNVFVKSTKRYIPNYYLELEIWIYCLLLLAANLNFKFRIVIWNIFFIEVIFRWHVLLNYQCWLKESYNQCAHSWIQPEQNLCSKRIKQSKRELCWSRNGLLCWYPKRILLCYFLMAINWALDD